MVKLDDMFNREYQDPLVDIAINHWDYSTRVKAVKRISRGNIRGLQEVALHAHDLDIAMKAVNRIYDQSALVFIAKNAIDIVAETAIENISQNGLIDIVLTSTKNDMINLALGKITSQANLVYIFLNTHNHRLKSNILFSISDENTLTKIVLKTSDEFFIKKAISKIKDKTLLLKIINNGDAFQSREAEKKLNKIYEEESKNKEKKSIRNYPPTNDNHSQNSHKQASHNISDGNPFTWYSRKY